MTVTARQILHDIMEHIVSVSGYLSKGCCLFGLAVLCVLCLPVCMHGAETGANRAESSVLVDDPLLQRCNEVLDEDPDNYTALFNKGYLYAREKQYKKALDYFQQAYVQSRSPRQKARVYYNMGNVHFYKKKLKEALAAYRSGLRLHPADPDLRYNYTVVKKLLEAQKKQQQQKKKQQQNKQDEKKKQGQDKDASKNKDNKKQQPEPQQDKNDREGNRQQQRQQREQQRKKGEMNKEDAMRILQTLNEQEKKNLEKRRFIIKGVKPEKNW